MKSADISKEVLACGLSRFGSTKFLSTLNSRPGSSGFAIIFGCVSTAGEVEKENIIYKRRPRTERSRKRTGFATAMIEAGNGKLGGDVFAGRVCLFYVMARLQRQRNEGDRDE
jgi:hypothetical protein